MKRAAGAALLEHPNQYAPLLGLLELRRVRPLYDLYSITSPLHHGVIPSPVLHQATESRRLRTKLNSHHPPGSGALRINQQGGLCRCLDVPASGVTQPARPISPAPDGRMRSVLDSEDCHRTSASKIVFWRPPFQAVATYSEAAHPGISVDATTEAVVTLGATEALSSAMLALLNPGDEVSPSLTLWTPLHSIAFI